MTRHRGTKLTARERAALSLAGLAVLAAAAWVRCGPLAPGLVDLADVASTEIVDRDGQALYEALSEQGGRSRPLDPDRLPEVLVHATLAAEDSRFFRHAGIDPLAIARALWRNARAARPVEGGSTLTQQTVKVLAARGARPSARRGVRAKLREAVQALRLEHHASKRQILALYFSSAPYGNQLVGARAASLAYFGCDVDKLTPAQAAFLAGLPQRPGALNPYRNEAGAIRRQQWVLGRMARLGYLGADELAAARAERLRLRRDARAFLAPHFVERALEAAGGRARARRVETTLDAALQSEVQGILRMHRERLERHGAHDVAVAVLDNARGEWLAWEGSGDYFDEEHGGAIDGVVTPRQPGSALKPFTYALAFDRGFTPASVLPDVPAFFATAQPGVLYGPRNYDGVFRGPLRARSALAGSENVPAVWLLSEVGVADLLRLLRRAGLSTLDKTADYYGYALTMGDAEVRLDELVAAYSALARGGIWRRPRMVRATWTIDGARTREEPGAPVRIVSARAAFWVADVLADRRARSYVFGSGGSLDFPFPVAVKTGTSQAYHDNWTVGFTRDVTVGVWVGNFDREPLRASSGVTGAAPIFHDVMLAAQKRATGWVAATTAERVLEPPPDVEPVVVCALSGRPATDACPSVETEWLPAEGRRASCAWHRRAGGRTLVAWPAQYRGWARQRGLLADDEPAAPAAATAGRVRRAAAAPAPADDRLRIVSPPAGATYLRDPTLRAEFQTVPLRASAPSSSARLTWIVDGRTFGESHPDRALDWPLATGEHRIEVRDARGQTDAAVILVK